MRYGLSLATLGPFADPRQTVRAARAAEEAGWEAFFVWDHLAWASFGAPSSDPWVTLGACAATTSRILLGTAATPLPRRRPQMVAQQLASLSLASGGRVIFGAGLGGMPDEFERFGEDADASVRAAMLDEGLDVVARLLRGEHVEHHGRHYVVDGATLAPLPLRPVPFWIGGNGPRALRRAARWDGWLADGSDVERNWLAPERRCREARAARAPPRVRRRVHRLRGGRRPRRVRRRRCHLVDREHARGAGRRRGAAARGTAGRDAALDGDAR